MKKGNLLLAIISGLILALSMPRPGIWLLAWFGLTPLLAVLKDTKPREAALYGLVTGLVYFGVIVFWISIFGYLPWILVALFEAAFFAAFAVVAARLMRGGWGFIAVPAAWTAMQWVRSIGAIGFTWGSFAHTQANNVPILQLSSLAGPWLIDFVMCMVNLAIAEIILAKGKRRLGAAMAAIIVTLGAWGIGSAILKAAPKSHPKAKVAIIQGNVSQDVIPDMNYLVDTYIKYSTLSRQAADNGAELIVWPETTLPTAITDADWGPILSGFARKTGATYVIGGYAPSTDPHNPLCYNSAHFYGPDGQCMGVYHKVHLVPYGEFVPLRDYMPFLNRYGVREQDVLAGKTHNLIRTNIGKAGVNICFESLFPQISRIETKNGAQVLFVITNDAWFKRTQAAQQHLMMSRLRAVENRRYLVRGAATGISAIIDPYGRLQTKLGVFKQGIVSGRIEPQTKLTVYTRIGDVFAYACAIITLLALMVYLPRPSTRMTESGKRTIKAEGDSSSVLA